MNVLFLDYDGVVNTPMWDSKGKRCTFNFPEDNAVNNFQCVQWVSEFCQKYDYKIVVTSTWRLEANYKECLINGGLRDGVEIIGKTKHFYGGKRAEEIADYLKEHTDIDNFLIIDDDFDMGSLQNHLVYCDTDIGFNINKYFRAEAMHNDWSAKNDAV